jgi:hypothetical protein
VNLIRQYSKDFALLVPHRAFSAATLIAMGANAIVMHKMGCLGPIDPSVANAFNPAAPGAPGQQLPISVEDVSAFFKMVKEEVGITHEDELVQALTALTGLIHPLALGNVQRSHNQSRLMARKLLTLHMQDKSQEHKIEKLIDNLKSKLFFHGHPINREEAQKDLDLKVEIPSAEVESLMWDLYLQYETDSKLTEPFNPLRELELKLPPVAQPAPLTTQQIVQQMQAMAALGIGLGAVTAQQMVDLATAMIPVVSGQNAPQRKATLDPIIGACIESVSWADLFKTDLRIERTVINSTTGPQDALKQEILWQRWEKEN